VTIQGGERRGLGVVLDGFFLGGGGPHDFFVFCVIA